MSDASVSQVQWERGIARAFGRAASRQIESGDEGRFQRPLTQRPLVLCRTTRYLGEEKLKDMTGHNPVIGIMALMPI